MFNTSSIELSPEALKNNLRFIHRRLKKGTRLCSVIKGNAYGHGFREFVTMAMDHGVDYFGVHAADEAWYLEKHFEHMPDLFIMGSVEKDAVDWAIEKGIEFTVFDRQRMEEALFYSKKLKKRAKIHIEMETGMHRTGFELQDIDFLMNWMKRNSENIIFQGLFTHFAGAENQANFFRITRQIERFNHALATFQSGGLNPLYYHTACSAVLLNYPDFIGNMARIGIIQYGFWPNKETLIRFTGDSNRSASLLRRVIGWKSKVMATKEVKKGNFIGYGTSYLAHKNMKLAIIPLGYSHGYSRSLSNNGAVLINGKIAPVVGTVNMNSFTVDITNAGNVNKGDEVVLIGKQKSREITVNSFSEQSKMMNYELLTRLPRDIERHIQPSPSTP
jgi:alanine racemase